MEIWRKHLKKNILIDVHEFIAMNSELQTLTTGILLRLTNLFSNYAQIMQSEEC